MKNTTKRTNKSPEETCKCMFNVWKKKRLIEEIIVDIYKLRGKEQDFHQYLHPKGSTKLKYQPLRNYINPPTITMEGDDEFDKEHELQSYFR